MKYKFYTFIYLFLFISATTVAQTGIGIKTPDQSSALEIRTTNKGVLLPLVTFTTAIGLSNNSSPVSSPKTGSLVYNTGGDFAKGAYYWDGGAWSKLVITDGIDQNLNLQINQYVSSNVNPDGQTTTIINNGTNGNYVDLTNAAITSSLTPGTYSKNTDNSVTLPAGNYKLDISLDCASPDSPVTSDGSNNGYFNSNVHLFALQAEIRDAKDDAILPGTTTKVATKIAERGSTSLQNYKYQFVFSLAKPTNLKLFFRNDDGSSDATRKSLRKYGLVANFYKLKL